MENLKLRGERRYLPQEVGMETPLLFTKPNLTFIDNIWEIPISHIQVNPAELIIEQQIAKSKFDRAIVPIWMIEGMLDEGIFKGEIIEDGYFKGVLKPQIIRYGAAQIVVGKLPEFHFYLETVYHRILGASFDISKYNPNEELRTLVIPCPKKIDSYKITPYFATFPDGPSSSTAIFRKISP